MSKFPRTFIHCKRCSKDVTHDPIHTCTPSFIYRAGMLEGIMLAKDIVQKCYDHDEGYSLNEVIHEISQLQDRYSISSK